MASEQAYLGRIDHLFRNGTITGLDERELLEHFVARRDESALEALIKAPRSDGYGRLPAVMAYRPA